MPSPSLRRVCSNSFVMDSIITSNTLQDSSFVRYAEFARASVQVMLDSSLDQLHYLGFVRKECYSKVHNSISATVYEHWDASADSGPATRPKQQEASCSLGLKVLALSPNGSVVWPESLMTRFAPGTLEGQALEAKQKAFADMYPESVQTGMPAAGQVERSNARTDFTIENGSKPIDPSQKLELTGLPAAEFTLDRWVPFEGCLFWTGWRRPLARPARDPRS